MVTNFIANLQFFSQRHEKHMLILKVTHALQMLTSSHNFVETLLGDLSKVKMAICPCTTFLNKRYHHENEKSIVNLALISNSKKIYSGIHFYTYVCNFFHRTLDYTSVFITCKKIFPRFYLEF